MKIHSNYYSQKSLLLSGFFIAMLILLGSFVFSGKVFAGGAVGGGGNAGGGASNGSGYSTRNGWSWVVYDIYGPGPSGGFRDGTSWAGIQATCQNFRAGSVMVYGIANAAGKIKGYNYKQDYSIGQITAGRVVDYGRATAVPTSWAQQAFNELPSKGVNTSGYTFGGSNGNVSWFCTGIGDAVNHDPQGDAVMDCRIGFKGWVLDADNLNARLGIIVVIKRPSETWNQSNFTISSVADKEISNPPFNTQNLAAFGVSGNRGFSVSIPSQFMDGTEYSWTVLAINAENTPGAAFVQLGTAKEGKFTCPPAWDVGVSVSCVNNNKAVFTFTKSGVAISGNINVSRSLTVGGTPTGLTAVPTIINEATFGGNNSVSFDSDAFVLQLGQKYSASISINPGGSAGFNDTANDSSNCESSIRVARPYFRVYGNDVVVGRQFMSSGACGSKKNSGIDAFNSGSGSDYKGAGVQFAASATNAINGFMSASMHSNSAASSLPESGLTFSNNDTNNIGFDNFGYTGCVGDYEQLANNLGGFSSMPTNPTDIIDSSGKIIVNGDLTIDNNINSPNTAYTKLEDIKSNLVIVKGNIYIDASVNKIDGLFIAIPDGAGNGGIINTCGSSDTPNASCNNDLTVTGAFIAKKVLFNRLKGDLANAVPNEVDTSDKIAEKFIFTPDFYLGLINYLPNNDSVIGSNKYDSIVGLPPVL